MDERRRIRISADGKEYSLRAWVALWDESYDTALRLWQKGERDPYKLIGGRPRLRPITDADIRWLRETEYARKGTPKEWELACDLIGRPRSMAETVRKLMEGNG